MNNYYLVEDSDWITLIVKKLKTGNIKYIRLVKDLNHQYSILPNPPIIKFSYDWLVFPHFIKRSIYINHLFLFKLIEYGNIITNT